MKILFGIIATTILACGAHISAAGEVTPAATQLAATIDALNVEQHWPVGLHVHWETGIPDGKPEESAGKHTHCSAFVAAAAKQLGIYLLRPPEHPQILLANAQYDWLATQGAAQGWQPLKDEVDAQNHANRGFLVVATYKNHHDDKPGHIAIVHRPPQRQKRGCPARRRPADHPGRRHELPQHDAKAGVCRTPGGMGGA
jgi:hypothetical protein